MIVTIVITDHPSWLSTDTGAAYRAVRCGTSIGVLTCTPTGSGDHDTTAHHVSGAGDPPVVDVLDPATLVGEQAVVTPLREAGTVARWRNPDLWDALATSIVRQVIRAGQARTLYRAFCRADGERVATPVGETWLFPAPDTVLALPDAEFARLGLAFKCRPLRATAAA